MTPAWSLAVSLLLLALNAFFVAAEFALVAAKRHRLEEAAARGSRSAGAALDGVRELSMMLAGAQLGITLCTIGLGALAKPTVADLLSPVLGATGLPDAAAYAVAFIAAVLLVGFLHVVIGEMAPKSWAISGPERAALLLAPSFRLFTRLTRPALRALNGIANACLRLFGVEPRDELSTAHGPEELRLLVVASREHGTLSVGQHDLLTAALAVQRTTLAEVMIPADAIVGVPADTDAAGIERRYRETGRSRLAVVRDGAIVGFVHLRDAVRATSAGRTASAADLATPALRLPADLPVAAAVRRLRGHRAQLALTTDRAGTLTGLVTLEDLLEQLLGEFTDETDPLPAT
ncbi:membrane protein [Pilimelia anulata]|uniref:Membrane protein n=1 Tax=Pilimelia anulata TaxID=53371 RepID=A0A8J3FBN5_9ACTN|nr:hemolysin family protein [Pilimelia anulata]GGJ96951.1 membrane protein [Pilimelia anulata]